MIPGNLFISGYGAFTVAFLVRNAHEWYRRQMPLSATVLQRLPWGFDAL